MRTLLVIAVLGCGCDKAKDEPTPKPTPTPTPTPAPPPADAATVATQTACDTLLVFLETGGTWIGAPPNVACFGENTGGQRDTAWLKKELLSIQSRLADCKPSLEVAAANGVLYQDLITAMDLGMSTGIKDVGVSNPVDLPMKFTMSKQPKCDGSLPTKKSGAPAAPLGARPAGGEDLKSLPVVIVTRDEIKLGGESVISIADAMKESNKQPIPELQRVIPAGSKMVILQADASTDAKVINRVIKSTKAAGVDDLLFATKNR